MNRSHCVTAQDLVSAGNRVLLILCLLFVSKAPPGSAQADTLNLRLRSLDEISPGQAAWQTKERSVSWNPAHTAVVICDMWDQHWCQGATARVAEMAPRMNQVISALRDRGMFIIHCPSDTMEFYRDHPGRRLAQSAPKIDLEAIKATFRDRLPAVEPLLPIDDSDGGCDDQPRCPQGRPWRRQIATIQIHDQDAITDSAEAYYLMVQRGITNVIIMGVHQNMCVLGRPFAIRQLVSLGQNVALMRDLTDSMYNSRQRPFVDHFVGNRLVTEHIEKYWCPTITSDQIIGGTPFCFAADTQSLTASAPQTATYRGEAALPSTGGPLDASSTFVFHDQFESALRPEWTWLRESPNRWRIRDGALEIRVEPGDAHTVRNALLIPAPNRSQGRYQIEVTVRNLSVPTQQFEQAGITWYSNGQPVFKLVKELVDGQLMMIPSRKPMTHEMVRLRLTVDAHSYLAEFQPNAEGPFETAAQGELSPASNEQVSLQCYHGPPDRDHWIRFDDFHIVRLPRE